MTADRWLGAGFIALGGWAFWIAWGLQVPFAADPLGPTPFPATVALVVALCGLGMVLRPVHGFVRPERLAAPPLLVGDMVAYALLMVPLGFMVATALMATAVAWLFGARPLAALGVGVVTALLLWLLFDKLLDLPLPKGILPL
ncbi:MAG: tripartite tricarboxylate transporter TctB family protein [Rubritepida sp.]|nr:tripartite tricarboxylate transporter TctB family protein [Rubritepida sp.]